MITIVDYEGTYKEHIQQYASAFGYNFVEPNALQYTIHGSALTIRYFPTHMEPNVLGFMDEFDQTNPYTIFFPRFTVQASRLFMQNELVYQQNLRAKGEISEERFQAISAMLADPVRRMEQMKDDYKALMCYLQFEKHNCIHLYRPYRGRVQSYMDLLTAKSGGANETTNCSSRRAKTSKGCTTSGERA